MSDNAMLSANFPCGSGFHFEKHGVHHTEQSASPVHYWSVGVHSMPYMHQHAVCQRAFHPMHSVLQVVEDVNEGYVVTGINTRASKNATELKAAFNYGRSNRDMQMMDLGSVHERTAAIFNIWLAQYAPAAVHGEEDRMIVSAVHLVVLSV